MRSVTVPYPTDNIPQFPDRVSFDRDTSESLSTSEELEYHFTISTSEREHWMAFQFHENGGGRIKVGGSSESFKEGDPMYATIEKLHKILNCDQLFSIGLNSKIQLLGWGNGTVLRFNSLTLTEMSHHSHTLPDLYDDIYWCLHPDSYSFQPETHLGTVFLDEMVNVFVYAFSNGILVVSADPDGPPHLGAYPSPNKEFVLSTMESLLSDDQNTLLELNETYRAELVSYIV